MSTNSYISTWPVHVNTYNGACNENDIINNLWSVIQERCSGDPSPTSTAVTFIHPSAKHANAESDGGSWLAGCSASSQCDMKGSVWESAGRAYTSRPCGPDSRSLITVSPARLSWDTPWTLHRTDGGLLNMEHSQAFPLLTAAACVDNVIPVAPEASYQAKNGYQQLAGKSSVSCAASAFC